MVPKNEAFFPISRGCPPHISPTRKISKVFKGLKALWLVAYTNFFPCKRPNSNTHKNKQNTVGLTCGESKFYTFNLTSNIVFSFLLLLSYKSHHSSHFKCFLSLASSLSTTMASTRRLVIFLLAFFSLHLNDQGNLILKLMILF